MSATRYEGVVRQRGGFTLIELLVVIAIIALLIAILMPSLSNARAQGQKAYCLNNMKEIMRVASMYMDNDEYNDQATWNGTQFVNPGKYRLPWHLGFENNNSNGATYVSEFIYGGFMAPIADPWFPNLDAYRVPIEKRPFNKYLAPELVSLGSGTNYNRAITIGWYICPGDQSNSAPLVGSGGDPNNVLPLETYAYRSWQANGNSYPINWYWFNSPPWRTLTEQRYADSPTFNPSKPFGRAGAQMLKKKVGGPASRFALFYENCLNSFMYDALPRSGQFGQSIFQKLRVGWHREFSKYSVAFLDGHAANIYWDTRYVDGQDYTSWPEPGTPMW